MAQSMVQLRGDDTVTGLRDWIKTELKEGPRQSYDLGKFFITVSTGTIGALAAIEKLKPVAGSPNAPLLFTGFAVLVAAMVIGLYFALPKILPVSGNSDLLDLYEKQIRSTTRWAWVWFGMWFIGTILGVCAIYH